MDIMSSATTRFVTPKSFEMVSIAGATREEDTGEMNVKQETVQTAAHFFPVVQFLGFSGSSGPSHVTYQANQLVMFYRDGKQACRKTTY